MNETETKQPDPKPMGGQDGDPSETDFNEQECGDQAQALAEEVARWRDLAVRTAADFDNFRKRVAREREEAVRYGNQDLLRICCFDVGITSILPLSPRKILHLTIIISYQFWFSFCYVVSQLPFLLPVAFFLLRLPFILPIMSTVGPCPHDKAKRSLKEISPTFCYMYLQFWITRIFRNKAAVSPRFPTKPLLYIYGNKKNVLFHSQSFLDKIDHSGMSKWLVVEDAGHWIMHSHPQLCISELKKFMS
jgi:pimeloyl-ACP methyl ester carboxylesterase